MGKNAKSKQPKAMPKTGKKSGHLPWPKFINIHALIANSKTDLTNYNVLVLEKLDGSNLGLEIHPSNGLVAIHGRKDVLWHTGLLPEQPLDRRFGPIPDTLESLSVAIIPNLAKLADKLLAKARRAETVIFYGEWYKASPEEPASWFPFGYAMRDDKPTTSKDSRDAFCTMTTTLYDLFVEHHLQPPKVLFSGGTLPDAVDALFPAMLHPSSATFEGIFITRDDHDGGSGGVIGACKWKTGHYEEQSKFVIKPKHITSEVVQSMVDKLQAVFETKVKKLEPYKPPWRTTATSSKPLPPAANGDNDLDLDRQITLATHSVLSKTAAAVEDIDEEERANLKQEIIQDVKETLMALGSAIPNELAARVDERFALTPSEAQTEEHGGADD